MAKGPGDTRCSRHQGDPYTVNGVRLEYYDLPQSNQRSVQLLMRTYERGMKSNLRDKAVELSAGKMKTIIVGFNGKGIEHVVRDAMMKLSGKYFSKDSLYRFDEILAKSEYIPTSHDLYKDRNDGITHFYKYADSDGRGVIIKIAHNPTAGDKKYFFVYSIDDIPP